MTRSHRLFPLLVLAPALLSLGCGGPATPTAPPAPTQAASSVPTVAVRGGTELNAGEVDYAKSRDFVFTVANTGGADLDLALVHKSCSCADVEMPPGAIKPGDEGRVVIHWAATPGNSGPYKFSADVKTNDPRTKALEFVVLAHIKPRVRVFIDGKETNSYLSFGDNPIPPGESRSREITVFSEELPAFKLDASSDLPGLDVSRQTPLVAGTNQGDYKVKSGYTLEVRTTDKLPLGSLRADLSLTLGKLGDEPDRTIHVPVYAVVGNGVFTLTPATLLFKKPDVTDEDTARVNLTFLDRSDKYTVEVLRCEPKFLRAEVAKNTTPGGWRVTAHLPQGSAAKFQADGSMEGQVVLKIGGLERTVIVPVSWEPQGK